MTSQPSKKLVDALRKPYIEDGIRRARGRKKLIKAGLMAVWESPPDHRRGFDHTFTTRFLKGTRGTLLSSDQVSRDNTVKTEVKSASIGTVKGGEKMACPIVRG